MGSHLKRLVIHRFRNVLPGTELTFHPGINVVLGKNGSGKTTLLCVLEAVLSGDFELFWNEEASITAEFDVSWQELPVGPKGINHTGHTTIRYESKPGERRTSGEPKRSERLDIEIARSDGRKAACRYANGKVHSEDGEQLLAAAVAGLEGQLRRALPIALVSWSSVWSSPALPFGDTWRFAEDLSDFDWLMGSEITAEDSPVDSFSYPSRLSPLFRQWAAPDTPLPRQLTISRSPIHEAAERMGFLAAEVSLRANDTGAKPVVYGDLSVDLQRMDGSWVREEFLSWGQKRFLSWWALRPDHFIIADEITNGMHHEWITTMIEGMAGRQCFLATQNPLLLDHLEFQHADEVQARIVRCSIAEGEPREQMRWRNPTTEEAQRFFGAYTAGFQHVSEILRNEDLW